jgi:hypothetical protein
MPARMVGRDTPKGAALRNHSRSTARGYTVRYLHSTGLSPHPACIPPA